MLVPCLAFTFQDLKIRHIGLPKVFPVHPEARCASVRASKQHPTHHNLVHTWDELSILLYQRPSAPDLN